MYSVLFSQAVRASFFLLTLSLATVVIASNTVPQSSLVQLKQLSTQSAGLVKEARSAQAKASSFRINVTLYRETLRSLMLDNRKIKNKKARIPQNTLINMVRMSALLSSAAECRTGRYIVCPAELMRKLTSQQQIISKDLDSFKAMLNGIS